MKKLKVYFNNDLAGVLIQLQDKSYCYEYTELHFSDHSKPVISLTLPKTERKLESLPLFPFFFHIMA
ncbi:MAG: HipA-like protein [Vicingaceae bacterium]|jgi:HipA-like protein